MKRVCILSMQMIDNFGSVLQSYSLKKMLNELDADVKFIDIEKKELDDKLIVGDRLNFKNESKTLFGVSKIKNIDRYLFNKIFQRRLARKQIAYYTDFRTQYLGINIDDNNKKYDLCVIGSDEVFNCMSPTNWGFTTQLFGNVKQANKVITYAASCGATTIDSLNNNVKDAIKATFNNVSGFSVRDNNTKEFVEYLTDTKIYSHLDPVWVGDFEKEISNISINYNLPKKFCIIYSYKDRIHSKEEINAIKKFCKDKSLVPVAIGGRQKWIKKYIAASPFEMLKIFAKADFIITDTFHGTIFSQKFNGHFAVLFRDSNRHKLSDLVKKINAENHVISNFYDLEKVYGVFEDRQYVAEKVKSDRNESINYLSQYL